MPPDIRLRLAKGSVATPWVFAGEVMASSEWELAEAGTIARLETARGAFLGLGSLSPNAQLVFRLFTTKDELIDAAWFQARLKRALDLRASQRFCRIVHAEADFLPGLTIDRFGDILVAQVGIATMERLAPLWQEALFSLLPNASLLFRNDIPARALEGLKQEVRLVRGHVPERVWVEENGFSYAADLWGGQKTGWFYDQAPNRALIAGYAPGKTLLDLHAHTGGFGLLAAARGARAVTLVDSSAPALKLAEESAARGALKNVTCLKQDAGEALAHMAQEGRKFDLVLLDPPAFAKQKKDVVAALRAYQKMVAQAVAVLGEGGLLLMTTCSHHITPEKLQNAVKAGAKASGARARILEKTKAGSDHPVHPHLPQTGYLNGVLVEITCA